MDNESGIGSECRRSGYFPLSLLIQFDVPAKMPITDLWLAAYFAMVFIANGVIAHLFVYGRTLRSKSDVKEVFG